MLKADVGDVVRVTNTLYRDHHGKRCIVVGVVENRPFVSYRIENPYGWVTSMDASDFEKTEND